MEAEEKGLSVGVVCKKKDEEPGPCGSAAHFLLGMEMEGDPPVTEKVEVFLLGMEMEGDPPVTEKVEGDALKAVSADLCCTTNDSNSQFSSPINVAAAVNDDQVDAGFAVDDDSDIESTAAVDDAQVAEGKRQSHQRLRCLRSRDQHCKKSRRHLSSADDRRWDDGRLCNRRRRRTIDGGAGGQGWEDEDDETG
jgi:hypothetical protein